MTTTPTCAVRDCNRKPAWTLEETYGRKHYVCARHLNSYANGIYGRTRELCVQRPWPPPKEKPVPRDPPPHLFDEEMT